MQPDLSIIVPTCNRARLLRASLAAIASTTRCRIEVIVVDGASGDDTPSVLKEATDRLGGRLKVIHEERREGFVRGVNKGFRAATGRNMTWLNDDARPLEGSLDNAVAQLDGSASDVGFVAMFHHNQATRSIAYETQRMGRSFKLLHVRGTLYANFGIGRRSLYKRLDYFDERYFLNAADPDFSLKVWSAGLRVVPAFGALIDHDEYDDARRVDDSARAAKDNQKLFAKWPLPARNPAVNDFDPLQPCSLRGTKRQVA